MPVISVASGSQTTVISTVHTLATKTTFGVYVLSIDTGAMLAGDILLIEILTKVRNGDTSRIEYSLQISGVQSKPNLKTAAIPVPASAEIVARIKQTAGTARSFPWNLLTV